MDSPFWICKSEKRFVINNPKNLLYQFLFQKIGICSKFYPPYWIRHFEFFKSVRKFVISDPKNHYIPIFSPRKWNFFKILSRLLDPPFWICESHRRFVISDSKNAYIPIFPKQLEFFQNFILHIGFAILNLGILKKIRNVINDPKNPYIPIPFSKNLNFFKVLSTILDPTFWIIQIW